MQQIVVSDGFYDNPKQMSSLFFGVDYIKNENFIQGSICPINYCNDGMLEHIEHVTNTPSGVLQFVQGSGSFIINQQTDLPTQTVCVNFPDLLTQWVGIVCLSESEQPHFLRFYKHKKTGWNGVPNSKEELAAQGINTYDEFQQFLEKENVEYSNNWEETTRIEFGFNKLILFRPGMFHSYNDVYGDTKETGRLLQFFFLKPKTQV